MGAGDLRDLITITRSSKVSNGRGGTMPETIVVAANVPAKIVVRKGGEEVQSRRLSGVTPHDIYIRYNDVALTSADVIADQHGTVYAVKWVGSLDEGRKRWTLIMAETGTVAQR